MLTFQHRAQNLEKLNKSLHVVFLLEREDKKALWEYGNCVNTKILNFDCFLYCYLINRLISSLLESSIKILAESEFSNQSVVQFQIDAAISILCFT